MSSQRCKVIFELIRRDENRHAAATRDFIGVGGWLMQPAGEPSIASRCRGVNFGLGMDSVGRMHSGVAPAAEFV